MAKDYSELIDELPRWNNGAGIDARSWVGCMGSFELAVGYSLIFWPGFIEVGGYVLREGYGQDALARFEQSPGCTRQSVEWLMNHVHIADLHHSEAAKSEAQLRYLGRLLKEIHEVKLRSDFPDRRFEVEFNDEPGLELIDYQMSFWQAN